jgi:hypothetical protein
MKKIYVIAPVSHFGRPEWKVTSHLFYKGIKKNIQDHGLFRSEEEARDMVTHLKKPTIEIG